MSTVTVVDSGGDLLRFYPDPEDDTALLELYLAGYTTKLATRELTVAQVKLLRSACDLFLNTHAANKFGGFVARWARIPAKYVWQAVDRQGLIYAYPQEPHLEEAHGWWIGDCIALGTYQFEVTEDWRTTKRLRPGTVVR